MSEAKPRVFLSSRDSGHLWSRTEKLRYLLPCIRQRLYRRKHLFAGPFTGEFGYELMQWQGFVRALRARYDEVHVLTYPGRDYLYEGCKVHYHDIQLKNAGYWYGMMRPAAARQMAIAKACEIGLQNYDIFNASMLCTQYHKKILARQIFRLFEEPPLVPKLYDVAFHFRAINKDGHDPFKNYPPALAAELVQRCQDRGISVACIGHPEYSACPPGCPDHRSVDLRQTVAAISSARTVAGENSGPMHLANICGKPTILWAYEQWRLDYSFRWNPFRVPLYVAANNTAQPAPELVCTTIANAIADIRARTDNFQKPIHTLPAQPIPDY